MIVLYQAPPSIPALHIGPVRGSGQMASDKVFTTFRMFIIPGQNAYMIKGSRKLGFTGGFNVPLQADPFNSGLKILDCGDIPVTPYVVSFSH